MAYSAHPRLYISNEHFARLRSTPDHPVLTQAQQSVRALAEKLLTDPSIEVDPTKHNAHLIRARFMQKNVVSLLVAYKQTGDARYRTAIIDNIRTISEWEYWSWIAWRQNDPRPEAVYDLSCGENSATLAIAYDALASELTQPEAALFIDTARQRSLQPYLTLVRAENKPWWYSKHDTNWNTVCNGGAGMLALALGDLFPESAQVIELVDAGFAPYFESMKRDGAWPEGIGYWNYGMRYAYMYLLSSERATGRRHRLLELPAAESTLMFPLLFTPNNVPCSFGDVNSFSPLPFHFAAAERYGRTDICVELERKLPRGEVESQWPNDAELLLLFPRETLQKPAPAGEWSNVGLMDGLEWAYLADAMPRPKIYASVRGGTIDAPHVHHDLMSFFVVVNDEALIDNVPVDDYIDTTFSSRRFDLYECGPNSKNTIFINGVGIIDKSKVSTTRIAGQGFDGFRIDSTAAMGFGRDRSMATFCGRAVLLVQQNALLVIDRIELPHAGTAESRLHTFSSVTFDKQSVEVRGKREWLSAAFAASKPTLLRRGTGTPTDPRHEADTMVRHITSEKIFDITLATLLLPSGRAVLTLDETGPSTVLAASGDITFRLEFMAAGLKF
jgi:hypothetical protein